MAWCRLFPQAIFPRKLRHRGGEISLMWALRATDELSFRTRLRTRTDLVMILQAPGIAQGPALPPPHLCSLEQKSPTDIIHPTTVTKVEPGFPHPSNPLLSPSSSEPAALSITFLSMKIKQNTTYKY